MNKHTTSIVGFGILGSILAYNLATAWVGPSAAAPNNNATPPVNVGSTAQTKEGSLGLTGTLIVAGSSSFGSGNAPAAFIDIGTNTALQRQAIFTRGADSNFRIIAQNGSATNASGQEVGRFGLEYNGSGWNSGFRFIRGGGALDGSLAIDTNGTERIRIDSAGNVGIGTTAPTSRLDVNGGIEIANNDNLTWGGAYGAGVPTIAASTASGGFIYLYPGGSTSGVTFTALANGNVGVGTTTPATKLDVAGTIRSTSGGFTFPDGTTQTTAATGGNYIQNQTAAAQSAANFRIAGSGRFSGGYGALGISGATELAVGAGGTSPNAASISFGDNSGWKLNIGTNVASVFTPRVTIQDNNRFGINNGTPSYIFDVGGAGAGTVTARLTNNNSIVRLNGVDLLGYSNTNMWLIGNSSSSELNLGTAWDWDRQAAIQYTPGTVGEAGGQLAIGQIQKNAATWTHGFTTLYTNGAERVRVNSAGNVGIGTSSPGYRLDVTGQVRATTGFVGNASTATALAANGTNCAAGSYARGVDASGNAESCTALGTLLTGSGTANYVTKWSSASGLTNSSIYDTGTNVGISTTNPLAPLQVGNTGVANTNAIRLGTTYAADSTVRGAISWADGSNITGQIDTRYDGTSVNMNFGSLYNGGYNSTSLMTLKGTGRLGIGTASPAYKVEVVGDLYTNGGWLRSNGSYGWYSETYGGGWFMQDTTWIRTYNDKYVWTGGGLLGSNGGLTVGYGGTSPSSGGAIIAGNTGIGTSSAANRLSVESPRGAGVSVAEAAARIGGSDVYTYMGSLSGGSYATWLQALRISDGAVFPMLINPSGGNVGIGNTSPSYKLQVTGTTYTNNLLANNSGAIGSANSTYYDIGAGRIAAGDAVYSYGRLCAGNSSGDCSGTGGVVISGSNIKFPDASTLSSANGLWNQDAIIFKTSLMANGDPAFRTTSTSFMTIGTTYGPFGYATPACPAGKTRRFKLFAELVDNITSGGQNVEFRINFTSATDLVFNLNSTWGGSPYHRTWLSSAFADPGTGDHATIEVRINGTAGPYVEMRNAELWVVCQ